MEERFIKFVADIMEADSELSMETKYQEYEKWDSLMMLNLAMELEAEYNVSIPMTELGNVRCLRDLYGLVQ